jgi:hypothetical protein
MFFSENHTKHKYTLWNFKELMLLLCIQGLYLNIKEKHKNLEVLLWVYSATWKFSLSHNTVSPQ